MCQLHGISKVCFLSPEPSEELRGQVYKLVENSITVGVQDLSSVKGSNEKAFYIVQVMCVAVELLVWAVQGDSGELGGLKFKI